MSEVPLYKLIKRAHTMARMNGTSHTSRQISTCGQANQFKNNYFTEMCSGSEAGSYLRLIDFCIAQL